MHLLEFVLFFSFVIYIYLFVAALTMMRPGLHSQTDWYSFGYREERGGGRGSRGITVTLSFAGRSPLSRASMVSASERVSQKCASIRVSHSIPRSHPPPRYFDSPHCVRNNKVDQAVRAHGLLFSRPTLGGCRFISSASLLQLSTTRNTPPRVSKRELTFSRPSSTTEFTPFALLPAGLVVCFVWYSPVWFRVSAVIFAPNGYDFSSLARPDRTPSHPHPPLRGFSPFFLFNELSSSSLGVLPFCFGEPLSTFFVRRCRLSGEETNPDSP